MDWLNIIAHICSLICATMLISEIVESIRSRIYNFKLNKKFKKWLREYDAHCEKDQLELSERLAENEKKRCIPASVRRVVPYEPGELTNEKIIRLLKTSKNDTRYWLRQIVGWSDSPLGDDYYILMMNTTPVLNNIGETIRLTKQTAEFLIAQI